ncbi:hypothetical protein ENBRE01_0668 [Enteropsectra breve]|nr:hypothetical protein ENBRE01_0668 [Enteropsectra breve]
MVEAQEKFKRIQDSFGSGAASRIYGREKEQEKIKSFLISKESLLHITGKPGVGKTHTLLSILASQDYFYLNYYHHPNIGTLIAKASQKIIVIDEFDRYYLEKKNECTKSILKTRKKQQKLITISNDLKMGNLKFMPYDPLEISSIIRAKIEKEIGAEIIEEKCMSAITKNIGKNGDLRQVFKYILLLLSKKYENGEALYLKLTDLLTAPKKDETTSVHHQMIKNAKRDEPSIANAFKAYVQECKNLHLAPFTRQDFSTLYEVLK